MQAPGLQGGVEKQLHTSPVLRGAVKPCMQEYVSVGSSGCMDAIVVCGHFVVACLAIKRFKMCRAENREQGLLV